MLTIGNDVATTDKKSSNPSAFTVMEKLSGIFWQRLVIRFKSADPAVTYAILESILAARPASEWRRLCIDASSEKYHAQTMRKRFQNRLAVDLISNAEAIDFQGERYSYKTLLGDLYVSAFEDGIIALPPDTFILDDHRLVKKQSGGYTTEVDEGGNHGDTFDSGKLAYWGHLNGSGKVRVQALSVGGISSNKPTRPGLIGSIARRLGVRSGPSLSS
jgi:hypothetical protein